jgi:alanyl-tRNA synthetase
LVAKWKIYLPILKAKNGYPFQQSCVAVYFLLSGMYYLPWLCLLNLTVSGTHIKNTSEAEAFALLSEEGIAKGVRRITAVTAKHASDAIKDASSIDSEINEASKLEGAILEKTIASIKSKLDTALIPAARKADLKGRVSKLEDELRKAKKKMGEENIQKAVKFAIDAAQTALSEGKRFCVAHVDVGLDTSAIREAVIKVKDQKVRTYVFI